ncbi:hypothetical protein [Lichenihabitans psoromatis]|uniref:hypothetical protein n=1 Tax=Lichenihabitans psoromatis TaxID=2528642 RepID=UPI001035A601|nr:hypothetical protein [Lichenihabitans psoromatis]
MVDPANESLPPVADDRDAPIIFFDQAGTFGAYNGIGHITLSAILMRRGQNGTVKSDEQVTAYLRTNLHGLRALQAAIEGALLIAEPLPQGSEGKAN